VRKEREVTNYCDVTSCIKINSPSALLRDSCLLLSEKEVDQDEAAGSTSLVIALAGDVGGLRADLLARRRPGIG
jgi:hypothetical protein